MTSWLSSPALLRTLVSHARLAVRLVREPHVSRLAKALPLAAVLYVISPLDFVPDIVPALGQLDDLGILMLALEGFLRWCPAEAVAFHRAAIADRRSYVPMSPAGQVIDVEWRREK